MAETWTIRRLLAWARQDFDARGVESARLDAELLLAEALGVERVALYLDLDRPLAKAELTAFRAMVQRRRRREPVAYILGRRGFYGRDFSVGPAVLIPRPDSETLVRHALQGEVRGPALDLCTGSGALGLSLAAERPELRVDLTDLSKAALDVARVNAERLGLMDRVRLFEGDLLSPLPTDERYGLVVVNPPYIAESELSDLMPDVVDFEPRMALVAGESGYAFYRRLRGELPAHLSPGARVLMEVGAGQASTVADLWREDPAFEVRGIHVDYGGVPRVVEVASRP